MRYLEELKKLKNSSQHHIALPFRYLLKHYDTNQPMYFGRRFKRIHVEKGYMSGGAGYVLSKEALKR